MFHGNRVASWNTVARGYTPGDEEIADAAL
jgi:hypothetical protein